MKKNKEPIEPNSFILPQHDILASLALLLDRSNLSNAVKEHCGTALKVMGIIYTDLAYDTGTQLLSRKEFDDFFKLFPEPFFNNRGLIAVDMIVENIKKCIKTDKIMCF